MSACPSDVNSIELKLLEKGISLGDVLTVECLEGSECASIGNEARFCLLQLKHFVVQICTRHSCLVAQVVLSDDLVLLSGQMSSYWISHPSVEVSVGSDHFSFL